MHRIIEKELIAPGVVRAVIEAPKIARKRQAGQFIIIRLHEKGERIPLTIADADPENGTITIIAQTTGKSTAYFENMPVEEGILDVVGPLGHPTHIRKYGHVVCIGGGIGIAPVHPITQAMKAAGNTVTAILGGRSRDYVIMEEEMKAAADRVLVATDDGSYGRKGFVTDVLGDVIEESDAVDLVVAIGPIPMMKAVSDVTRSHEIPTLVSLNALMVDGTGMCGACRVTVGGETKFTCVDGPEFDGHAVDFEELLFRLRMFDTECERAMKLYGDHEQNPRCVKKDSGDE